jgi:hypothetical protein
VEVFNGIAMLAIRVDPYTSVERATTPKSTIINKVEACEQRVLQYNKLAVERFGCLESNESIIGA